MLNVTKWITYAPKLQFANFYYVPLHFNYLISFSFVFPGDCEAQVSQERPRILDKKVSKNDSRQASKQISKNGSKNAISKITDKNELQKTQPPKGTRQYLFSLFFAH